MKAARAAVAAVLLAVACGSPGAGSAPGWCPALHAAEHARISQARRHHLLAAAATSSGVAALSRLDHAITVMLYWHAAAQAPGEQAYAATFRAARWAGRVAAIAGPLDRQCGFTGPAEPT